MLSLDMLHFICQTDYSTPFDMKLCSDFVCGTKQWKTITLGYFMTNSKSIITDLTFHLIN